MFQKKPSDSFANSHMILLIFRKVKFNSIEQNLKTYLVLTK